MESRAPRAWARQAALPTRVSVRTDRFLFASSIPLSTIVRISLSARERSHPSSALP